MRQFTKSIHSNSMKLMEWMISEPLRSLRVQFISIRHQFNFNALNWLSGWIEWITPFHLLRRSIQLSFTSCNEIELRLQPCLRHLSFGCFNFTQYIRYVNSTFIPLPSALVTRSLHSVHSFQLLPFVQLLPFSTFISELVIITVYWKGTNIRLEKKRC